MTINKGMNNNFPPNKPYMPGHPTPHNQVEILTMLAIMVPQVIRPWNLIFPVPKTRMVERAMGWGYSV
jgi:hypothetical protein